jgi:hypothetical protein
MNERVPTSGKCSAGLIGSVRVKEIWKRQREAQRPAQSLLFEEPSGGVLSKRTGARSHVQTWRKHRGAVWVGK